MLKKIALGGLGLALVVSPVFVSADVISDLQAQIQVLLTQITALKSQNISPPQVASIPLSDDYPTTTQVRACPNLATTMQRGARDATTKGQVSDLQAFLANQFGVSEESLAGGYFGSLTESYVKKFQSKYGLPTYGIVGSLTRAKIAEVCRGSSSTFPPDSGTSVPISIGEGGVKCGVNSYKVENFCGGESYRNMYASCHDGYEVVQGGETSCKPASVWEEYARTACANRCSKVINSYPISVTVSEPNKEGLYYNQSLSVTWFQGGSVPKGSRACVILISESTGTHFSFPAGGGNCVDIAGEEPMRTVSGAIMQTLGYLITPGSYRALVQLIGPATSDGNLGALLAEDKSDAPFKIGDVITGNASIKVTNVTGNDISVSYANVPAAKTSVIMVRNKSTGVAIHHHSIYQGGSGSVLISLDPSVVSTGTYYLEIQGEGVSSATSEPFSLTGTAPVCSISTTMFGTNNAIVGWTSTGATSATTDLYYLRTNTYDSIPLHGSQSVTVNTPTVYSFWFKGPGGSSVCVSKTIQ